MSTQPSRVSNSVPTISGRTPGRVSGSQNGNGNGGVDPLFLPTDSQFQYDTSIDGDNGQGLGMDPPRLSQAEVEAISGLGDMEDLLDGMDDLQHEEEVEEMRASQQAASQGQNQGQGPEQGMGQSQNLPTRQPLAERILEPDPDIFGPIAGLAAAGPPAEELPDPDVTAEGVEDEGDTTRQADFVVHEAGQEEVGGDIAEDRQAGLDLGAEEGEEEDMLPATQHPSDVKRVSHPTDAGILAHEISSSSSLMTRTLFRM
jgi:hypothetical protein